MTRQKPGITEDLADLQPIRDRKPNHADAQEMALSVDDIRRAFGAEDVTAEVEQLAFVQGWNATRTTPLREVPITNHAVGRLYHPRRPTSQGAALAMTRTSDMRDRVLEAIKTAGPLCDEEIAKILLVDLNSVRPRRRELERRGAIEECGRRRTRSGRIAIGWRAT